MDFFALVIFASTMCVCCEDARRNIILYSIINARAHAAQNAHIVRGTAAHSNVSRGLLCFYFTYPSCAKARARLSYSRASWLRESLRTGPHAVRGEIWDHHISRIICWVHFFTCVAFVYEVYYMHTRLTSLDACTRAHQKSRTHRRRRRRCLFNLKGSRVARYTHTNHTNTFTPRAFELITPHDVYMCTLHQANTHTVIFVLQEESAALAREPLNACTICSQSRRDGCVMCVCVCVSVGVRTTTYDRKYNLGKYFIVRSIITYLMY